MDNFKPLTPEKFKDRAFRKALRQDAKKVLREYGWQIADDIEVVVLTDDKTRIHFAVPDTSGELTDIIDQIQAAGIDVGHTVGTLGTVSTEGTVSSGFSCFFTFSSAGTVGTAGTAKVK